MVRQAFALTRTALPQDTPSESFEVLALDEGSVDNTLSALSILHTQYRELRSLQDLPRGRAIQRAARCARGAIWVISEQPIELSEAQWAIAEIRGGRLAALVPGRLLSVRAVWGRNQLSWFRGDLRAAQRFVRRKLHRARSSLAVYQPPRGPSPRGSRKEGAAGGRGGLAQWLDGVFSGLLRRRVHGSGPKFPRL